MKSTWRWLKDYFDLSFGERRGITVLLILIFFLAGLRYALPYLMPEQDVYDFTEIKKLARALEEKQKYENENDVFTANDYTLDELEADTRGTFKLFVFDPNSATKEEFQQLGLPSKLVKTIINYRNKGGKFYKKEDLKKIYGLKPEQYQRLEPYINLSSKTGDGKANAEKPFDVKGRNEKHVLNIELNSADSAGLVMLRGIGPAFAARIIKYRNLLGGYVRKEQLLEVYGLDSSKYAEIENQLIVNPQQLSKININLAGKEELGKHPYIKYKLANAIVLYRQRHGSFKNIDELKKIYLIDQHTFEKISPYLVVE